MQDSSDELLSREERRAARTFWLVAVVAVVVFLYGLHAFLGYCNRIGAQNV